MPKYLLPLIACLLAALALAACGGASESDEEEISNAIAASLMTDDPADCEAYSTQAFLEQTEGETGEAAVASCEEDVEDTSNNPDEVTVSKVKVDGEDATAQVAFKGGGLDRQTVIVELVKEDGDWKLDRIESFAVFDRNAFVATLEEGFATADLSDEQTTCVREALKFAEYEQLEAVILEGEEALLEIVADC